LGGWGSTWSSLRFWRVPASSGCLLTSSLSPWLHIQHRFSCAFLSKRSRRSLDPVLPGFKNLIWRTSFTILLGLSAKRTKRGWLTSILSYLLVFFISNQSESVARPSYMHISSIFKLCFGFVLHDRQAFALLLCRDAKRWFFDLMAWLILRWS
jgi:hypothetical protein